ncbi:cupredoxin domain-containing protein [uncultured Gilvimarinus sp.]|uniref:cupredoxin domain-containing protein n=1 Tax=uncultured Gilvimarinus sp. TaxID=1689143 RepID=UPI0030DB51A3
MLFVNLAGVALIVLIVWWFWLYKPQEKVVSENDTVVTVESGTYTPSRLQVAAGRPITLAFLRRDPSPCSEVLLIPGLEISETLPLNKRKSIKLPALPAGEYEFHCQMQMYQGKITVS